MRSKHRGNENLEISRKFNQKVLFKRENNEGKNRYMDKKLF